MGSLEGLLPLFWQLAPLMGGLMVLRCLPMALRLQAAWRAGRNDV